MADERIIVAGCSGFVGRNVVKMLLNQGHPVIGLSRTNPNIYGLEFIEFDLTDKSKFSTSEYSEATIINAAALTSNSKTGAFEETNYFAVLRMLALNPEGKFIHISSSSIYDLGKSSEQVREGDFQLGSYPFFNLYSQYKALAENAILTGVVEREVHPVSLRPHAIYGEDDTTLIPKLRQRAISGSIILPEKGEVKHSLTHIRNLLHAVECALSYQPEQPEAFNVTDASPVTIAHAVASVLGKDIKIKGVPTRMALGMIAKMLGAHPYEVRQLGFERTYDLTKARNVLGYNPTEFTVDWA